MHCVSCSKPFCSHGTSVYPAPLFGEGKSHLPETIDKLYHEARVAVGADAPTAAELVCRTLLSHIAKGLGWDGKGQFVGAVDHIAASGFVTKPLMPWVDRIRTSANQSAHDFDPVPIGRAQNVVNFVAQLLELVYVLPAIEKEQWQQPPQASPPTGPASGAP
jgi:hypothetical protein